MTVFSSPSPRAIELQQALPPNSNSPTATMESKSALLYKGSRLDERVERDMPMTTEDMRHRLGVAQVEALFDFIPVATLAAAAAAATLTAGLFSLGFVEPWIGAAWVCYIVACALGNLSLLYLYRRSRSAHTIDGASGRSASPQSILQWGSRFLAGTALGTDGWGAGSTSKS